MFNFNTGVCLQDMLDSGCLTPDCEGSVIEVEVIGANGEAIRRNLSKNITEEKTKQKKIK